MIDARCRARAWRASRRRGGAIGPYVLAHASRARPWRLSANGGVLSETRHRRVELFRPQRTMLKTALTGRNANTAQGPMLRFRFHAIRDDPQTETACEIHDPANDFGAALDDRVS